MASDYDDDNDYNDYDDCEDGFRILIGQIFLRLFTCGRESSRENSSSFVTTFDLKKKHLTKTQVFKIVKQRLPSS